VIELEVRLEFADLQSFAKLASKDRFDADCSAGFDEDRDRFDR
jgi:hypothetical protein